MSAVFRIPTARCAAAALIGLLLATGPLPARAVIVAPGDGTGNTAAPADDFGFANVGTAIQTVVYIGNGWVITANHVKLGDVTLGGVRYPAVPGSKRRLFNEDATVSSDLAVFRLREPIPNLPSLPIRSVAPEAGEELILMGNGHDRGEVIEVGGHPGWKWASGNSLRWGTNRVHERNLPVKVGRGDETTSFSTRLSPIAGTLYESTVAVGDSGGGAFMKRGDTWELAGVLFATNTYGKQPPRTTFYGNITFIADLSVYRDQVVALTSPPACRDGLDDDGDGLVDFPEDEGCTSPDDPLELSACDDGASSGDADGNGVVDGRDYAIWADQLGSEGPADADFDCDGAVGPGDYAVWRAAYSPTRATAHPPADPRAATPPESPSGLCGRGFAFGVVVPALLVGRVRRGLRA